MCSPQFPSFQFDGGDVSIYQKNGDNVMFNMAVNQNPGTSGTKTAGEWIVFLQV